MKIYLILLTISFISSIIVSIEVSTYTKKHYKRIKNHTFAERLNAKLKSVILLFMIFPYIISLLCVLFAHDFYIGTMDKNIDLEYYEKI